jgi:hypothetical protein
MNCCNHNCNQGRACLWRKSAKKSESADDVALAIVIGLALAVTLFYWLSK